MGDIHFGCDPKENMSDMNTNIVKTRIKPLICVSGLMAHLFPLYASWSVGP